MKRNYRIKPRIALLFFIMVMSNFLPAYAEPNPSSLQEAIENVQDCDRKIESNMDNLNKLKEQISEKENEIKENSDLLKLAQEKVDKSNKQLSERLKGIQLNGGLEVTSMQYIDALFSSGNVLDALHKVSLISQICTSDKNLILEAKESKKKLLVMQDNIDKERKDLEINKEDVENKIKELEDQKGNLLKYIQENGVIFAGDEGITVPITLPSDITGQAKAVIEEAERYLKVPYVWGGESPEGFDCSGLIQYVFKSQGIDVPRISEDQQKFTSTVDMAEIKPGDLVFNRPSDSTHVGMYIGDDMYIQAPHTGDVVKISKLSTSNMKYVGRVLN
ncbi:NlpC/P60 family protein [Clostridium sp.]|uniref:C40 family peptidase n=1 Tax=Clostridium sp. TaxID=1506 RepID=UPI00261ABDC2|nr:C40 family peptidase [Clostridium sp.]